MARHKDASWTLSDRVLSWEEVNTAVLMDIRDELKTLNAVLRCPNFMEIPRTLRTIRANTSKPKRRKLRIAP